MWITIAALVKGEEKNEGHSRTAIGKLNLSINGGMETVDVVKKYSLCTYVKIIYYKDKPLGVTDLNVSGAYKICNCVLKYKR